MNADAQAREQGSAAFHLAACGKPHGHPGNAIESPLDIKVARAPGCRMAESGNLQCFPAQEKRSEEHTSELQSLMRTSYAVICLKKKIKKNTYEQEYRRKHHNNSA